MITPPTITILTESGPVLFADCPFCLAPLPVDLAAGTVECAACGIHAELAPDPEPAIPPFVLAPAA